jgi:hypothetical protein
LLTPALLANHSAGRRAHLKLLDDGPETAVHVDPSSASLHGHAMDTGDAESSRHADSGHARERSHVHEDSPNVHEDTTRSLARCFSWPLARLARCFSLLG